MKIQKLKIFFILFIIFCLSSYNFIPFLYASEDIATYSISGTNGSIMGYGNNVYPIEAVNVFNTNANVILVNNQKKSLGSYFGTSYDFSQYWVVRVEKRSDGCYSAIQSAVGAHTTATQVDDGFLLLIKRSAYPNGYYPIADWPEEYNGDHTTVSSGDTIVINYSNYKTTEKLDYTGTPYGYITIIPKSYSTDSSSHSDDIVPVDSSHGVSFKLFNYSENINKDSSGNFRSLATYFNFRSSLIDGEAPATNTTYDADGFGVNHATVEYVLSDEGYPVIDLTRDALSNSKTDPGLSRANRDLGFLFGGSLLSGADSLYSGAVTSYSPKNTMLQTNGVEYWYNSPDNAVDYDISKGLFRLRPYPERSLSTAGYGTKNEYYDFLPFNYTNGITINTSGSEGRAYTLENKDVDYWFGMTMEFDFYQPKNGMVNGEPLIFTFYGDDDVWVFIDDVLILDLGGTHGAVRGEIDFSTGEVKNVLDFNGVEGEDGVNSFPTNFKNCFSNASTFKGETIVPNGGWSEKNNNIFGDYTQHTFKLFYLERGAGVANCNMFFNVPSLPKKSLIVSKVLEGDNLSGGVSDFLMDTLSYKFRIVKADENGNPTDELYLPIGTSFRLFENDIEVRTDRINADGYFELKGNQMAQFDNLMDLSGSEDLEYIVQEVLPDNLKGQYSEIEYTVGTGTNSYKPENGDIVSDFVSFSTPVLKADEGQIVSYKNIVNIEELSKLKITKVVENESDFSEDTEFKIQVKLGDSLLPIGTQYKVGDEIKEVLTEGIILLGMNETAELIDGIISGTSYEIVVIDSDATQTFYRGTIEKDSDLKLIEETEDKAEGEFDLDSTVSVEIESIVYDFKLDIPIEKRIMNGDLNSQYLFDFEAVFCDEMGTVIDNSHIFKTSIIMENERSKNSVLSFGFKNAEIIEHQPYYIKVYEKIGEDNSFVYDNRYYIFEIMINDSIVEIIDVKEYINGVENIDFVYSDIVIFENIMTVEEDALPDMGGNGYLDYRIYGLGIVVLGLIVLKILKKRNDLS